MIPSPWKQQKGAYKLVMNPGASEAWMLSSCVFSFWGIGISAKSANYSKLLLVHYSLIAGT